MSNNDLVWCYRHSITLFSLLFVLGRAFISKRRLPQSTVVSWDLEFVTPPCNVKETLLQKPGDYKD
jgi:hypothetical protein